MDTSKKTSEQIVAQAAKKPQHKQVQTVDSAEAGPMLAEQSEVKDDALETTLHRDMPFGLDDEITHTPPYAETRILVLGVGGCGSNATYSLYNKNPTSTGYVDYACINTDIAHLRNIKGPMTLTLGEALTKGQGAGADPKVGKEAAKQSSQEVHNLIKGYDMVFLVAGMGGGTGTGAAPVVAELIKEENILTVAVVTTPFRYEGKRKARIAAEGIETLAPLVHCLIEIPNHRLSECYKGLSTLEGYEQPNKLLHGAIECITSTIASPGHINADFADVRAVISEKGTTVIGRSDPLPVNEATRAVEQALKHPLLADISIENAKAMLINFTTGQDFTFTQMEEAMEVVERLDDGYTNIVWGHEINPEFNGRVCVSLIVTGINDAQTNDNSHEESAEHKAQEHHSFSNRSELRAANKKTRKNHVWEEEDIDVHTFLRKQAN